MPRRTKIEIQEDLNREKYDKFRERFDKGDIILYEGEKFTITHFDSDSLMLQTEDRRLARIRVWDSIDLDQMNNYSRIMGKKLDIWKKMTQ